MRSRAEKHIEAYDHVVYLALTWAEGVIGYLSSETDREFNVRR